MPNGTIGTGEEVLLNKIEESTHKLKNVVQELSLKVELMDQRIKLRDEAEDKTRNENRLWIRTFLPLLATVSIISGTWSCGINQKADDAASKASAIDKFGTAYGRERGQSIDNDLANLKNDVMSIKADVQIIKNTPK